MNFSAEDEISFSVSHEYPEIDETKTNRFRIYVTDDNPVHGAKLYRNYVMEAGRFVTLEQKAEDNPNIRKLYGAPFVYLGGDLFTVSADDIDWAGLPPFSFRSGHGLPAVIWRKGGEWTGIFKCDPVHQKSGFCRSLSEKCGMQLLKPRIEPERFLESGRFHRTVTGAGTTAEGRI